MNKSINVGELIFINEGKLNGVYLVKETGRKNVFGNPLIGVKDGERTMYCRVDEIREPTESEMKKYKIKSVFTN